VAWLVRRASSPSRSFGKRYVTVVQIADQGVDTGALAFRLLVLARSDYLNLGGDPFLVADQFPAPWAARGELPALFWPAQLLQLALWAKPYTDAKQAPNQW